MITVKRNIVTLAILVFITLSAIAQEVQVGYNPFVPANLNDTLKLPVTPVVESSYHKYWITGDTAYTDASTFVWYVENGTLGTWDSITSTWTPFDSVYDISNGKYAEIEGQTLDSVHNSSEIWVRWNDATAGSFGYIAVYERSADNCIIADQISGFKHIIVPPPEIWFVVGNREECADQIYSVTVRLNNVTDYSYPYRFTVRYPGNNGTLQTTEFVVNNGDLDALLTYTFDLLAVQDLNVTQDETYTVELETLTDKYGSRGKIAPLGIPAGQYAELTLTIFHLPQTGGMTMD
jgi:hypothetical protein